MESSAREESPPVDCGEGGFSAWAFGWPLSVVLGMIALAQLATWLPHYLTWPYWADHDVFANAARAWDLGDQPYRDVRLNNFPGTIYLFYVLGKTFGWGRPWTFYALDSSLLLGFVGLLIAWSRKVFGRALPGLVGSLALLGYYLSLDYSHTAQRDWQGPALAFMGILVAQGWAGRTGRVSSALLAAVAFSIRPQIVLFLPALLLSVATMPGQAEEQSRLRAALRVTAWLAMFAALCSLAFLPLLVNGVFSDFLRCLHHVSFGSTYNRVTLASFTDGWWDQASMIRWLIVPSAILVLSYRTPHLRAALASLIALAGASLYKPLSPMAHSYLDIPLVIAWSVSLALLAGLVVSKSGTSSKIKLVGIILLLGISLPTLSPKSCSITLAIHSLATLGSGIEPENTPPGYRPGPVQTAAFYSWSEYRATLIYLRGQTKPSTKIANALRGDPAIVSAVDRRSAFPAESITWLKMVNGRDEPAFVESLERATDSVALWSPGMYGPCPKFRIPLIDARIRRLYRFEARFGPIEVWRRVDKSG